MRLLHLLVAVATTADAASWLTRWADDADCVDGIRDLEVLCVDDDLVVADEECTDTKPSTTTSCMATITIIIDANEGDDANNGTEAFPLRTLRACIQRFGFQYSYNKNEPDEQLRQLVCALKGGIYNDEPSTPLDSADHLLVRPYNEELVIFDGTDPYWDVRWSRHELLDDVVTASVPFSRRPEVIVGGHNIMCANESSIVDGNHDPKAGYGTSRAPCFAWSPDDAWVLGDAAFALDDAVAVYERGETLSSDRNVPWFWVDERKGEVHVDTSRSPAQYPIRIKNETRRDVMAIDDGCHRIHVRDLYFYGTSCCGAGPEYNSLQSTDLRLTRSRFLYAPADGIRLKSTKQTKRGGTPYVKFENNTAEFGEGALYYKGTGARILGNYFAFNSFEQRTAYTLNNMAQRSVVAHNTLLYNGDKAGHYSWARGNIHHHNLVIGQDFLGPQFDAAVFHALTGAQEGLVIEYNWVLGPSLVSFARLDTAQSTQPDEAGRYTTIKHNVHMGLGMTTKGYNHTIEHNTGSRFLQVESWASIDDHNLYTVARYNAHSEVKSRGSTLEFDAIPGYASLNLCGDLVVCNPRNHTAPPELTRQLRPLTDGVQEELINGAWPAVDTSGVGEGEDSFNEAGVIDGDDLLGLFEPHEIGTPTAEAMDFRPKAAGKLVWSCGSDCDGDGGTYGYVDQKPSWTEFDAYAGAYAVDDELWVPGCHDCVTGGKYGGGVFPYTPPEFAPSSSPTAMPSTTRPTPRPTPEPSVAPGNPTAAPVISWAPTPRPVRVRQTPAPVALDVFSVSGELYFAGLTCQYVEDNEDVFVAAIADLCGVDAATVSIECAVGDGDAPSRGVRRLQTGGVVVTYEVSVGTAEEAAAVAAAIAGCTAADVDVALDRAASDAGVDLGAATATAVGAPAWDSPAPTPLPTAWLSSKKNKKTAQMVVIISVCVCLGCCCLLAACGGGSYYVCKKRKKTPGLQEPSAPPLEAIPVPRFFSLRKKQRASAPPLDIPVAQPVGKI